METGNAVERAVVKMIYGDSQVQNGTIEGGLFYANLLMNFNILYKDDLPAIAGVRISDTTVELCINLELFSELSIEEQVDVLKHECDHVIGGHCFTSDRIGETKPKVWNYVTDVAINENLKAIKYKEQDGQRMFLSVDVMREMMPDITIKERMHSEYYLAKIKEAGMEEQINEMMGGGEMEFEILDDHSMWDESTANKEAAKGVVKHALDKAVDATGSGNVPGEVKAMIDRTFASQVNWKRELKQFFARVRDYNTTSTRKKRNRRYGITYAGKKKEYKMHIAVCTDSSGSVNDKWYSMFFSEIDKIADDKNIKISIIDADCSVKEVYEYTKGMKIERNGYGGTAYNPAIEYAKDTLDVDGILYMGDMDNYGDEKVTNPKLPFLWVIVGSSDAPADFGKSIRLQD